MLKKCFWVLLFAVAGVLAHQSAVSALTTTQYTTKTVMVTVVITPSPAPVGLNAAPPADARQPVAVAYAPAPFARYLVQPPEFLQAAAPQPQQVAQVQSAPAGNVPVNVNVKPDPTAAYLHITTVTPTLNAVYGPNTFLCVYRVFGYFSKTWKIDDWVYGTTSTGGSAGFPGFGYPTASAASWSAEGISSAYTPYTNAGQPGQLTFNGAANVTKDVCIDIQINVAPSIAAGTYSFPVTYALFVTF